MTRLTMTQKALVREAAQRHMTDVTLVRVGQLWGVVGREEGGRKWTGLLVSDVDTKGRVWWISTPVGPFTTRLRTVSALKSRAEEI